MDIERRAHRSVRPAGSAALPATAGPNGPTLVTSTAITMPTNRNQILSGLPADELELLAPHLEQVPLKRRMVAYDPLRPISHVYFVESGVISIVSIMRDRSAIETATIGREGVIGLPVYLGVDAVPEQAFVQVPGEALRLPAADFRALAPRLPTLQQVLDRY